MTAVDEKRTSRPYCRDDDLTAVDETSTGRPYCRDDDLPVNPFLALRVSFGMLLGEEDFRDLMGNPRGKQMLHNAWLHGSGVVWGYQVSREGSKGLRVTEGLALDKLGRKLLLDADRCLDLEKWLKAQRPKGEPVDPGDCDERVRNACLVASFDTCLARPVPALADPCDLSRKHNECSRVVETVRLELREEEQEEEEKETDEGCPDPVPVPGPYHRVRVLLGLDRVGDPDPAGELARERRREVAGKPVHRRARALLAAFRELAALDVADLRPATEDGDQCPSLFPGTEDDAAVVLATVKLTTRGNEVVEVEPSLDARRSLIATSTIQELVCGLAPALLGAESEQDAGGPRVIPESVWWADDAGRLTFKVTSSLLPSTLYLREPPPVVVTSLSDRGWVPEDIERVTYDDATKTVTVAFHDPPAYDRVRVIVRGTGPTPVFGTNNIPLAGLVGGPPGTSHDGHDVVLTTIIDRRAAQ
jgi:hypothetical protein